MVLIERRAARRLATGLATAAVLLTATACGSGASGSDSGDDGPIKLAVVGPLTGPDATYGVHSAQGAELAVEELNDAGGIDGRKFEVVKFDDQCEPSESAKVAAKVSADSSFVGVVGPVCSGAAAAALPVYARGDVAVVTTASAPIITDVITNGDYGFASRLSAQDAPQGEQLANLAINVLDAPRVAILHAADDYGQGVLSFTLPAIEKFDGQVVANESYVPGTTKDFTPQLTKIAHADPDVLLLLGYYSDTGTATRQLKAAGADPGLTIIGSDSSAHPEFIDLAGAASEGVYLVPFYSAALTSPENVKFVDAYRKAYNEDPSGTAVTGYQSVFTFAEALKAGSSDATLGEKVRAVDFVGPYGRITFNDYGDFNGTPGVVLQVQDGKLTESKELTAQLESDSSE